MPDTPAQPTQPVTHLERAARHGQPGCVIWLTGLSAAGKTTLAIALERALFDSGHLVYRIDGDEMRRGLCQNLGFAAEDRSENIRRAGAVAALFADAGFICIAAFISPLRADRELARRTAPPGRFIEVHVATPLAVCRERDPKQLYARATRGEIPEFTGISAPYETPLHAEVVVHAGRDSVGQCVDQIVRHYQAQCG
jgi:adenylyl-sulfate kinase